MQKLFAARVARIDRPHRLHHVVVTIHFIDESDSRLGILMGAGDDAVPDVRRVNHARPRRLFNGAVGKIRGHESLAITERHGRAIRPPINNVISHRGPDRK